jgi:hypothetical protein
MLPFRVFPRKPVLHRAPGNSLPALNFLLASTAENVSLLFSCSPALFAHFSVPKSRTTLVQSLGCALLQKQRRGWGPQGLSEFRSSSFAFRVSRNSDHCPTATVFAHRNFFLCNTSRCVDFKAIKALYLQHIRENGGRGWKTLANLPPRSSNALTSLECAFTQSADASPLDSAFTKTPGMAPLSVPHRPCHALPTPDSAKIWDVYRPIPTPAILSVYL